MKTQVEGELIKIICSCLLILASCGTTASSCSFNYTFHFGDGTSDIGNSRLVMPPDSNVTVPSAFWPYGITYPGNATGRWSDGLVEVDYAARDFGLPNIVPSLALNGSNPRSYDGVVFSVGRSPVLGQNVLKQYNITLQPYATPFRTQFQWFASLLKSVCQGSSDDHCEKDWLGSSLVIMGDIEGNDIGYGLAQGLSVEEVRPLAKSSTDIIIENTKKILKRGARRVIIHGNGPLGCYPYILTALQTTNKTAYDEYGCLESVNNLIIWRNNVLEEAVEQLQSDEFQGAQILFVPMYDGIRRIIANASNTTADGNNTALISCCGKGGRYNYDNTTFCGDKGVPVCDNPNDYIFWDGEHFTQQTQHMIEQTWIEQALVKFKCKSSPNAFLRPKRGKISSLLSAYASSYFG